MALTLGLASTATTACVNELGEGDPVGDTGVGGTGVGGMGDGGMGDGGMGDGGMGDGGMGDGGMGDGGMGGEGPIPTGDHLWSNAYGAAIGNGINQTHARAMASDPAGNVIVVGTFRGLVSFGGPTLATPVGVTDMFVAKYDAAGNHLWSKDFSTNMVDQIVQPNGVAVDAAGNLVIVGRYTGLAGFGPNLGGGALLHTDGNEVFVVKLEAAGDHQWSEGYLAVGDQQADAVALDTTGRVAVVGVDEGNATVRLLDSAGVEISQSNYGGAGQQRASDVVFDAAGNLVVVGVNAGDIDLGGGTLSTQGFDDIFIASLTVAGVHRWSASYGDDRRQQAPSIAADASGNLVVVGRFDGTIDLGGGVLSAQQANFSEDIFVAKLDADGGHLWSASYGGAGVQQPRAVAVDADGRVLIVGGFTESVDFGGGALQSDGQDDVFIAKFSAEGAHLWSYDAGDSFDQEATAVAIGAAGEVFVAGKLLGEMDLSGSDLLSDYGGGFAIFVAALSP